MAEAAFIFHPFARQIRDTLVKLSSTTENLFESRERLRIVTENAADWLWETDAAGMVTDFTSRAGHPLQAGQLLERQLAELVDPGQPQRGYDEVAAAIAARLPYRDIVLPLRPDSGPALWVRASGVPHWSNSGEFRGYLGVWTDISAAKHLEDELRKYQDNLEELVRQRTAELHRTSAELGESEEKFRLISTSANDAILIIDLAETILYWNPAACAMFGYTAAEAVGRNMHRLLAPARYQDAIRRGFAQFRETGAGAMVGKTVELAALRQDGSEFPIELSISSMQLNGRLHALGIIRDISERKKAEAHDRLLVATLEAVGSGVMITDHEARIEWTNAAFETLTGYRGQEAAGRQPAELFPSGLQTQAFYQDLWRTIQGGATWRGELVNRRKNGSLYHEELMITPVKDDAGVIHHFVAIKHDISERVRMEQELRQMATTDFLTGLANRRHFIACLQQLQAGIQRRHTGRAAVLMFDLDHFKRINDSYGHAAGDAVLKQVAALVRDQLRKTDSAGRVGGEEFAILLPESDLAGALIFAERLRESVEQTPLPFDGREIRVTLSIGVAAMDAADTCAESALARADMALYRAKEEGRNRVCAAAPDGAHGEEKTPCLAP